MQHDLLDDETQDFIKYVLTLSFEDITSALEFVQLYADYVPKVAHDSAKYAMASMKYVVVYSIIVPDIKKIINELKG